MAEKFTERMEKQGVHLHISEEAVDVTRSVGWEGDGTLLIPGSLIETLYRPTATPGDLSDPSVVFALVKEETL